MDLVILKRAINAIIVINIFIVIKRMKYYTLQIDV